MNDFLNQLSTLFLEKEDSKKEREVAWNRFLSLDLPSKKSETYRYVPLTDLYSKKFETVKKTPADIASHVYEEAKRSCLVFVDGVFSPNLSNCEGLPAELKLLPLSKAFQSFGSFLPAQFQENLKGERDPFAALNGALYAEGLFIYLPPNLSVELPLQIHHFQRGSFSFPRIHLFLGKKSSLEIHARDFFETPSWKNGFVDATLEEGAQLNWTSFMEGEKESWQTEFFRARLKKDATFNALTFTSGGKTVRQDFHVQLKGEGAEAKLEGLWSLSEKRQSHVNVLIEHEAPFTRSLQKFKGILKESAQASFEGKIFVRKEALKTEAFQVNQNLLLSEDARGYAKPHLEIFADDVKASHGATFGQLSEEDLFYLKTRGLSFEEGSKLLTNGFAREIIDKLILPSERKLALERI